MRVLLISANTEMLPDPVAPLGPACVASALRKAGHDTRFLDLCFIENMEAAVRETVSDFRPDCIGVSLRNLDNVAFPDSVSYLPFYKKIAETCRRVSAAPVFLGGAGFTLMPGPILEYLGADGGIAGEGEESFPALLSSGG
ncbi:MAG TPA: cobalamin-dependent protein, partial [Thermodesulfobacteriota bacterium]|nr:cobalamin-dependent protein [Thermodesulfobacteriota bacterium]